MVAITSRGATGTTAPAVGAALAASAVEPGSSEERVVDALLECIARWGLAKTTIEDVARASGLSRATVYRLFPGGKQAIVEAAAITELARLVEAVGAELERADDLEDSLTAAVSAASRYLCSNPAFDYLHRHEPDAIEAFIAFDRLDLLFHAAGELMAPWLERFLDPATAREAGVWAARVVLSYLTMPSPGLDPAEPADARRLVSTYLLPGLVQEADPSIHG